MILRLLLIILFYTLFLPSSVLYSQSRQFDFSAVYDSTYGIDFFDKYNGYMGNDSIRKHAGYAFNGPIIDYYTTGQIIHKGYYIDGQLRTYSNFYSNGKSERIFKLIDDLRSKLTKFYDNGNTKSEVHFKKGMVVAWKDFYPDGKPEMEEEYFDGTDIFSMHKDFFPSGQLETSLELKNKKKKIYNEITFYENGKTKETGEKFYDENTFYYQKNGKWIYYREDGSVEKEENYLNGVKTDP